MGGKKKNQGNAKQDDTTPTQTTEEALADQNITN